MNFIKSLNPEGFPHYNQVLESINLKDPNSYSTTEELREIRNILGISNSAYDFGLHAALVCVNSYPELLKQIGENDLIGYIASYERPPLTLSAGKLTPRGNQFLLNFSPYKIFNNLNLVVSYYDEKKLRLSLGDDTWLVNYENNRDTLIIHFPEELSSLVFNISLIQSWADGSTITVGLSPNGYPFKHVVENLKESSAFINVINSQGLLDSFLSIPELPYKIALATVAVSKAQSNLHG